MKNKFIELLCELDDISITIKKELKKAVYSALLTDLKYLDDISLHVKCGSYVSAKSFEDSFNLLKDKYSVELKFMNDILDRLDNAQYDLYLYSKSSLSVSSGILKVKTQLLYNNKTLRKFALYTENIDKVLDKCSVMLKN